MLSKRRIKRIAPVQLGKMLAVTYGALGIVFIPIFLLMSFFSAHAPAQNSGIMAVFGVGFAFIVPFVYAAMGFIFGIIGALIYNLIAKWIGGIEVEVE